jgi:hypothetical protein
MSHVRTDATFRNVRVHFILDPLSHDTNWNGVYCKCKCFVCFASFFGQ